MNARITSVQDAVTHVQTYPDLMNVTVATAITTHLLLTRVSVSRVIHNAAITVSNSKKLNLS